MIYLNHAATSWPKPPSVVAAMTTALQQPPPSAYRSTGGGSDALADKLRQRLGHLLGIAHTERIFLSSGATDSLNRLLQGLHLDDKPIFVTATEHNSVLRPLMNHPKRKEHTHIIPCDSHGKVSLSVIEAALAKNEVGQEGLLVVNHCSNVTGQIQDIEGICHLAHQYGMMVLVDVSQSAGAVTIDCDGWGCDALVFTGHKALLGPQGIGGYYLRADIPLTPLLYGGTGRDSNRITYEDGDYEYEVGTPNAPGIAGLLAGVEEILKEGVNSISQRLKALAQHLIKELETIPGVTIHSPGGEEQGAVVSFNIDGIAPSDAGYILANAYDIILRSGLHCCPLIHPHIGSEHQGTLRASFSTTTTIGEIEALIDAVKELAGTKIKR